MKYLLLVVAGLLCAGVAGLLWVGYGSLPAQSGDYAVAGINDVVEIRFDARRRPYVVAESLDDAFFAQGYLHAGNRLWQMELLRRAGSGRMAEALGGGLLLTDRELWRAGVPQLAGTLQRNASPRLHRLIEHYAAGVNAGIAGLRFAPPEFHAAGIDPRPWQPADVFAVGALIAFQSAGNYTNELLRLALRGELSDERFRWFLPNESDLPDFPYVLAGGAVARGALSALSAADALASLDAVFMPGAALGSNGWVVAPHRSANGRALFAFDSHDDLSQPNLFYEVHLFFPERRQVRGWSLPGLPGVINGYNGRLAWGLTNIGDTQDLFIEQVHPDDPQRFLGPAGYYAARVEQVEIPVAGRAEPEVLEVRHSRHGPLIHDDPPLALRWSGHDLQGLGLDGLLAMNLADDWQAFNAALDLLPAPTTNATYADTSGNIAFRTAGLVPLRRSGSGLMPRSGAALDSGWQGYVPAADLPRAANPAAGYLAAANARIQADTVPLVSADNAPGYRMRRLRQLLAGVDRLSLETMQRLQTDWYNSQAELLLPALLADLDPAGLPPREQEALQLLDAWQHNPVNMPDQAGPVIYEHFYVALARTVFAPHLSAALLERLLASNYVLNHALDRILLDRDGATAAAVWWQGERGSRVRQAFISAVGSAAAALGDRPADWRWDDILSVTARHELAGEIPLLGARLNLGPYPWGGGPATLGRARYRYARPFQARAGATVRVVAEMASPPQVRAIIPGGQSGHVLSAHYEDQMAAWLAGGLDPLADGPDAVSGPELRLLPR